MAKLIEVKKTSNSWELDKLVYELKNGNFVLLWHLGLCAKYQIMVFSCNRFGDFLNKNELLSIETVDRVLNIDNIINDIEKQLK